MSRIYAYLAILVGVICIFFFIYTFFFLHPPRTVRSDVVQGILSGCGLAFVSAWAYARIKATKVNGMLLRAAHAQLFPGPVNTRTVQSILTFRTMNRQVPAKETRT